MTTYVIGAGVTGLSFVKAFGDDAKFWNLKMIWVEKHYLIK